MTTDEQSNLKTEFKVDSDEILDRILDIFKDDFKKLEERYSPLGKLYINISMLNFAEDDNHAPLRSNIPTLPN